MCLREALLIGRAGSFVLDMAANLVTERVVPVLYSLVSSGSIDAIRAAVPAFFSASSLPQNSSARLVPWPGPTPLWCTSLPFCSLVSVGRLSAAVCWCGAGALTCCAGTGTSAGGFRAGARIGVWSFGAGRLACGFEARIAGGCCAMLGGSNGWDAGQPWRMQLSSPVTQLLSCSPCTVRSSNCSGVSCLPQLPVPVNR